MSLIFGIFEDKFLFVLMWFIGPRSGIQSLRALNSSSSMIFRLGEILGSKVDFLFLNARLDFEFKSS